MTDIFPVFFFAVKSLTFAHIKLVGLTISRAVCGATQMLIFVSCIQECRRLKIENSHS